ncbi:MAG TPA: sulfite exporter TauE/SafE family protein [Megamonas hypermegale]|nr:sulfite exporter TauE/SafE family protein [Megamonas hypermegale]
MIFISMLFLGALIGFVGAGGAGVTITLLTVVFDVPIHTALGVALASMVFTMISGVISHLREHEVIVKTGLVIGLGGIIGAFLGAEFSDTIPEDILSICTATMIILSAIILYVKVYQADFMDKHIHIRPEQLAGKKFYIYGVITGIINGFLSGAFGIGAAAFIQITLLVIFGVPLLKSIGTCMLVQPYKRLY